MQPEPESVGDSLTDIGFAPDSLISVEGKIGRGDYFSSVMVRLGMTAENAYGLSLACDSVFDVRTLRIGQVYRAFYSPDSTGQKKNLEYVIYDKDPVNSMVFKCRPPFRVYEISRPVVTERLYADVTISTSLWNDMVAAGVSYLMILNLSDIYAWTVDFFGLQKGDRFRVLYDQKVCGDRVIAVDTIRYAVFTRGNEDFPAIMYNQKDSGNIYWNDRGESMRKEFLKAPLKYSRISSGFSYSRKHPITRRVQPHTGVDYAAPAGTPVVSIGDGTVTGRKYEGAGGNTVRIRHNSVYSTAYLHLSRFAPGLKVGQRVRQGDVIGYVGSTGRSTGPHLDFRVWKNGSPINPLKMESPPAEPLKEENRALFESAKIMYKAVADSLYAEKIAPELMDVL